MCSLAVWCRISIYSSPSLIRTPLPPNRCVVIERTALLPNNSALIREVSFGERESHAFTVLAAKDLCPFYGDALSSECPLREGPL